MTEQDPHPTEQDDDAEGERRISHALSVSAAVLAVLFIIAGVAWFASLPDEPPPVTTEFKVESPRTATVAPSIPLLPFSEVTADAGITFQHVSGATGKRLLPETMGGGVAFFDYDNDGDQDLFLVNAANWPDAAAPGPRPTSALFANDGLGRFTDVTAQSGLDLSLYGMGVAVGDYDNDGRSDLYVTAVGHNRLMRNTANGFVDVSQSARVMGDANAWSTSAAFFDYDRDGDLDLFVCQYVKWSAQINADVNYSLTGVGRAYGPPTDYAGTQNTLYRNDGGRFTDVTAEAGIVVTNQATGGPVGKSLALLPDDINNDGWVDVVVANDTVRNFLFLNQQDGTFVEVGEARGLAFDAGGLATGAMGIDSAWFSNDPRKGIAIGNFANEMSSFYVSRGTANTFSDDAVVAGIGAPSRRTLTFGLLFLDLNLDGREELLAANGHVEPEINRVQASQQYAQPVQLFWNCGESCPRPFQHVETPVAALASPRVGRGLAYADIDADGDLDVVITTIDGPPSLLRNDQEGKNHWIRLRLMDPVSNGNRDAIGAVVTLVSGGITQRRKVMPARSYLSQVELPVTFGLGARIKIDKLSVRWPDGRTTDVLPPGPDQEHTIIRQDEISLPTQDTP